MAHPHPRLAGRFLLILVAVFSLTLPAHAEGATPAAPQPSLGDLAGKLVLEVSRSRLENGLRLVLRPEANENQVAVCTTYDAGVSRETEAEEGAAALLAALLRDGGRSADGSRYLAEVEARGGTSSVEVTREYTRFCTLVPHSELELAFWFEAGRLTSFALTPENLELQKRRLSLQRLVEVEDAAYARGRQRVLELALEGIQGYEHSLLPAQKTIDDISLETLRDFHARAYLPSRAVVSLAGNFDSLTAVELAERYLGVQQASDPGTKTADKSNTPQSSPRLSVLRDPRAISPAFYGGFRVPGATDPDFIVLEILAQLLGSPEGSKLHRPLLKGTGTLRLVETSLSMHRGPNVLSLHALAKAKASLDGIEGSLRHSILLLAQRGPSAAALASAQRELKEALLARFSSELEWAKSLGDGEFIWGDGRELLKKVAAYDNVTADQIKRAAAAYLSPQTFSVVEVYPKDWQDPGAGSMPTFHIVSPGESLGRIATRHGTSVDAIVKMNGIARDKPIFPGQKLRVPRGKARAKQPIEYTVKKGDTLSGIAARHKIGVDAIVKSNRLNRKKPLQIGQKLSIPRRP